MNEKCKHQMRDKASTWNNTVFRNCKIDATESGYCAIHDPENIAKAEARESVNESVKGMREINRIEESAVGVFMRMNKPEEFAEIIETMRKAQAVADAIRIQRRY